MFENTTYKIVKDEARQDEDSIQALITYGTITSRLRTLTGRPTQVFMLESDLLKLKREDDTSEILEDARLAIIRAKAKAGFLQAQLPHQKKPLQDYLLQSFNEAYDADSSTFNKKEISRLRRKLGKVGLYFGHKQTEYYDEVCAFLETLERAPHDITIQDQILMNEALQLTKSLKAPHRYYFTSPESIAEYVVRGGIGTVLGGAVGALRLHELAPAFIKNITETFTGADASRLQAGFIVASFGLAVGCYKARNACIGKSEEIEKIQANERRLIAQTFAPKILPVQSKYKL